ncbi:MAG: hypothetical protein PHU45_04360, partial [Bacilli bacterium]|nr:hypothetical protein [Bacilli bacterium]
MKTVKIINKILAGIIIVAVFFLTVGVAYSYYLARLNDIETGTTVTGNTGNLKMEYDGGPEIIANNIAPSTDPFATKTFTVKGNNTTAIQMYYQIKIVVAENTFSEDAITYTLTGINTAANGNTIPDITTRTPINQESSSLGIGNYDGKITDGVHTYELNIYFYKTEDNQIDDLGKTFKAHLLLENYIPPKLGDAILAQGGGASAIEEKDGPDFSKISTSEDTGLYSAEDEYGTSYYYRGEKTELNNNLIWGGFQWKIVRINGDGSIRLLYNGTEAQFNTNGEVNDTGEATQIEGTHAWNETNYNDAKYVGYMYGGANGSASSERFGTTSVSA